MAKRIVTLVIKTDDITGEDIPEGQGESFVYAWEGSEWEIDLNEKNASDIREMMGKLTTASRKIGRHRPSIPPTRHRPTGALSGTRLPELPSGAVITPTREKMERREFLREIRQWGRDNGYQQGMTGKLMNDVREAWNAAHPDRLAPEESSYVR